MGAGQHTGPALKSRAQEVKKMRFLKYIALLAVLGVVLMPAANSSAQVAVGVGIGVPLYQDPGYAYADPGYMAYGYPPNCPYGYYNYAPYACAPYGYYGPGWFTNGLFIGVGPWYGWGYRGWGWGHGGWSWGRGGYYGGRPVYGYRGGYGGYGRGYVGGGRGYVG